MSGKQVILVGNGTSVLDCEKGREIDNFDIVGRFNLFEIKGYEKHVGTKTDIWFCGLNINPENWRAKQDYRQIVLHSWAKEPHKCPVLKCFREMKPDAMMEKVDHAALKEMSEFTETSYCYWSTGAIAVWLLTRKFPVVHLTGFDWWTRREQHYFRPTANRGTIHKPEEEKKFIDLLASEGKIQFL